MRSKKKFIITFPKELVKEPWNYNLITQFDIIPNIVAGTISEDSAILGYEFDGERILNSDHALDWQSNIELSLRRHLSVVDRDVRLLLSCSL